MDCTRLCIQSFFNNNMKKENQISVKEFSDITGYTTNHVYELGRAGKIEIQEVAGFKVIDKEKYPPEDFKKPSH